MLDRAALGPGKRRRDGAGLSALARKLPRRLVSARRDNGRRGRRCHFGTDHANSVATTGGVDGCGAALPQLQCLARYTRSCLE